MRERDSIYMVPIVPSTFAATGMEVWGAIWRGELSALLQERGFRRFHFFLFDGSIYTMM